MCLSSISTSTVNFSRTNDRLGCLDIDLTVVQHPWACIKTTKTLILYQLDEKQTNKNILTMKISLFWTSKWSQRTEIRRGTVFRVSGVIVRGHIGEDGHGGLGCPENVPRGEDLRNLLFLGEEFLIGISAGNGKNTFTVFAKINAHPEISPSKTSKTVIFQRR